MRTRNAGGENLYDATSNKLYNEYKLAVIAYLVGENPEDIDSMRIDYVAVKIRNLWKYSSDLRGAVTNVDYSSNKLPILLAKTNVQVTDMAREAYWNYSLAKAVEDGQ